MMSLTRRLQIPKVPNAAPAAIAVDESKQSDLTMVHAQTRERLERLRYFTERTPEPIHLAPVDAAGRTHESTRRRADANIRGLPKHYDLSGGMGS